MVMTGRCMSFTTNSMMMLAAVALLLLLLVVLTPSSTEAWTRTTLADRLTGIRLPHQTQESSLTRRLYLHQNRNNNINNEYTSSTKQNQRDMVDFIQRPMDSTVGDLDLYNNNGLNDQQQELNDLIRCIVKAADGRKAQDIVVLNVHHITTLCSALVILSGNSRPQNQAIAAAIASSVYDDFDGMQSGGNGGVPEGSAASGWMLLDYGSVMVHIMTQKSRLYYNVEGQWKDKGGKYMDISDMILPNPFISSLAAQQQQQEQEQAGSTSSVVSEQDDPFWS